MAEKLTEQLTIAWSGKIMDVTTTDGTIDASASGRTFSNVQSILNNEVRFVCTVSDNYEIDTVTNTNEHFVVRCITSDSFIYTWADPTYTTDIIDTITITTRAIGDTPTVTESNTNLNITTLANTKWEFTLYPTCNIELLWDCLPSYPEYGYSIYSLNTKWDGADYGGIYFYTGRPDVYDDIYLYRTNTSTWYGPRTIEITDGDHVTDPDVIEFFKSQATLISSDSSNNITNLTGTTWKFNDTINDYSIIELVQEFPGDYYEDSTTLFNISYTFDGVNYNCLHIVPADASGAEPWDGNMIYYPGWNTTVREITFIGGNDATDENLLNFIKSNATLVSGGDSGESGDEPEGGDEPSTPTIGPNAQLTEFLTGIADAIREKTGTSDPINPQDFATTIAEMQTGGGSEDELLESYVEGTLLNLNVDTITTVASNAFTGQNFYTASLINCTSLYNNAFAACSNLLEINLPKCTIIGDSAFYSCSRLTTVSVPTCLSIYSSAFMYCPIQEISLPLCTQIRGNAFTYTGIQSINLPECTRLYASAFQSASDLTYISIPKCTSIGANAFRMCTNLESIYAPELLSTDYAVFGQCSNLTSITLPKISSIASSMFEQCYNLRTVNLPECLRFNSYAFRNCSNLTSISAPKCSIVYSSAFYSCWALSNISLPVCSSIGSYAFYGCSNFQKLYLMSSSICALKQTTAFGGTPMSNSTYLGYFGSIYVPASLLASYKTAAQWSYYSSRFVGV